MSVSFGAKLVRRPPEERSMPADAHALIEKIRALSPERLAEVEDYIDFLTSKTRRQDAINRLLAIAPALEAAGAPPRSPSKKSPHRSRPCAPHDGSLPPMLRGSTLAKGDHWNQ
jgi:hypothetical protein